jgi:hypothetical protein
VVYQEHHELLYVEQQRVILTCQLIGQLNVLLLHESSILQTISQRLLLSMDQELLFLRYEIVTPMQEQYIMII